MEEDRVRFARVRAPQDDEVGIFRLTIGAGAATCSEHSRQTDDARSVSSSVAAVDVVAAHHVPGELLGHVVHLVGGLRAAEHAERLGRVLLRGESETCGRAVQRLIPSGWPQLAVVLDQRLRQPYVLAHRATFPTNSGNTPSLTPGQETGPPRLTLTGGASGSARPAVDVHIKLA